MHAVDSGVLPQECGAGIWRSIVTNSGNQKHLAAFMRTVGLLRAVSLVAACGKAEPTPQASEASSGTMLNAAQTHAATPQTYSWNLADLYDGLDSPAYAADLARAERECRA